MKIHRDRPSDDGELVRIAPGNPQPCRGHGGRLTAAKDSPPLRGWPWKAAGCVEHLGRAARPALRHSPAQPPSTANHGHLR
jgi:hypothetical protein